MTVRLILGDCLERLSELDDASVDAVVTDPPYGISFMGKHWDRFDIEKRVGKRDVSKLGVRLTGGADSSGRKLIARTGSAFANAAGEAGAYDFSLTGNRRFQEWCAEWAAECLRVLKPGGHAAVFGGTRTYHRLAAGLEDAGFEIRDCLAWMYGSGFPKSLDVAKAIDKGAGHWRGRAGDVLSDNGAMENPNYERTDKGTPVTAAAAAWEGWGTALKPAFEPIVLARKPFSGSVAANVLQHGTGALNIDACRIEIADRLEYERNASGDRGHAGTRDRDEQGSTDLRPGGGTASYARWPANVILDEEAGEQLDAQSGELVSGANPTSRGTDKSRGVYGDFGGQSEIESLRGVDRGGASRFFYCAKTSRGERDAGLAEKQEYEHSGPRGHSANGDGTPRPRPRPRGNVHPTVKPIALMRWLCRLVTPTGGLIVDPFLGSGTTGVAAAIEGFSFTGIEREPDYLAIAQARIDFWAEHGEDALKISTAIDEREAFEALGQQSLLAEGAA